MQYLEEEVHRLRCKGKEDKGCHGDGPRIDMRGDIFINWVEGVELGVAPIYPASPSIDRGEALVRMLEKGARPD